MRESPHTFLLIGMPEAGKTTFLAALWNALNTPTAGTDLSLVSLQGDQSHLNAVLANWLEAEKVPRTHLGSEQRVEMLVSDGTGRQFNLVFPDLSGETFIEQWVNRVWSSEYGELVARADGLILIINPGALVQAFRIDAVEDLVEAAGGEVAGSDEGEDRHPWEPRTTETQIQLVDVVQAVVGVYRPAKPLPVAVIVSAWDLVDGEGHSPQDWVEAHVPLLWQYLLTNPNILRTRYYGISAQGGDLDGDRDRLLALTNPSDRVVVVAPDGSSDDITSPLLWLLASTLGE